LLLCLAIPGVIGGCASTDEGGRDGQEDRIQSLWPEPPEQPRLVFQTVLRSLADIRRENESEKLKRLATGRGVSTELVYEQPASIAARGGRIYVADPPNRSIVVFDVPRGRLFRFGVRPPHVMQQPNSLAIDNAGRVYVLDSKAKKVMVFDALGLFLFEVGDPKAFTRPVGVAVSGDGKRIYVVDRGSLRDDDHKVVVYSPSGEILQTLGPRGSEEGRFNIPLEAAVAPDGSVAVLDSGNFRVQIFDAEGRFVRAFGGLGNAMGQLSRPRGLAIDRDGNIYVSDANFNNVQIFNPQGQLLLTLGGMDMRGGPGQFALVGALAADDGGYVYVADMFFKKIEVYRRLSDAEGIALMGRKN
jgi:DNA-binding beta-propeller fold protein YncE